MKAPQSILVTGADTPIGERLIRELLDDSRVDRVLAVTGGPAEHLPIREEERLVVHQVDMSRNRRLHDLLFGPQGTLFVTDNDLDKIFVYANAGEVPVDEFSAADLEQPTDLAFGPRGRLYVASSARDAVLVFRRDGSVENTPPSFK